MSFPRSKVYSQRGEDGIFLALIEKYRPKGVVFECACGDGRECMSRNLRKHGWAGVAVERHPKRHKKALKTLSPEFEVLNTHATAENINDLCPKDADIVVFDVDGNDYWLWKALKIRPKIVCIESNPRKQEGIMPYDPNWVYGGKDKRIYHGASVKDITELGKELGYTLVDQEWVNLFFVRDD